MARRVTGGYRVRNPVAAGAVITPDQILCTNAAGYIIVGGDIAGATYAGVADEAVDNTNGLDGDLSVWMWVGADIYVDVDSPVDQSYLLRGVVYLKDSATVTTQATTTNSVVGGMLLWLDLVEFRGLLRRL